MIKTNKHTLTEFIELILSCFIISIHFGGFSIFFSYLNDNGLKALNIMTSDVQLKLNAYRINQNQTLQQVKMKPLYSTLHHIHTCGESNEIICLGHRLLLCGKKAKGSFSQLGFLSVRLVAAAANREGSGCYKGSHYCWKQELSSISSSQHPFCSQQKFHFFFFLPSPFSPTVPYPTSSFLHTLFTLTAGVACT